MQGYLSGGPHRLTSGLGDQLSGADLRKMAGYQELIMDILKTTGGPGLISIMQTQTHHLSSALEPDDTE